MGNLWLYIDNMDGSLVAAVVPGTGSLGGIFMQLQFPLHSGRILGLPGRILISAMGLVVAMLSVTDIVIGARRRRACLASRSRKRSAPAVGTARPLLVKQ